MHEKRLPRAIHAVDRQRMRVRPRERKRAKPGVYAVLHRKMRIVRRPAQKQRVPPGRERDRRVRLVRHAVRRLGKIKLAQIHPVDVAIRQNALVAVAPPGQNRGVFARAKLLRQLEIQREARGRKRRRARRNLRL